VHHLPEAGCLIANLADDEVPECSAPNALPDQGLRAGLIMTQAAVRWVSQLHENLKRITAVSLRLLQLVRAGRTVVVAARSAEKATEVFTEAGLQEGYQAAAAGSNGSSGSSGILIVESGVDVTKPETLTQQLFEGVTQVCWGGGGVGGGG
jgi:hypothetical protein